MRHIIALGLSFALASSTSMFGHQADRLDRAAATVAVEQSPSPLDNARRVVARTRAFAEQHRRHELVTTRSRGGAATPGCTSSNWRATMSSDEIWIDTRESRMEPTARNASGAFGLGQLKSYPDTTDPCLQLKYQREYIADRYGSEDNAVAFWEANGWY